MNNFYLFRMLQDLHPRDGHHQPAGTGLAQIALQDEPVMGEFVVALTLAVVAEPGGEQQPRLTGAGRNDFDHQALAGAERVEPGAGLAAAEALAIGSDQRRCLHGAVGQHTAAVAWAQADQRLTAGAFLGVAVFIQLAPKVLALIPGILRAAIIAKAAFPMSSMPGRVIQIAAPFDSLLMFVVLILPYQMTGGGWMVPAILLLTLAPIFFYVGGKRLAKPHTLELALKDIGWTRRGAIAGNLLGGLCLVVGLMVTVGSVEFNGSHLIGFGDIFLAVFTLIAEIFRLEVIGIDIMLGAMVGLHEGRRARAADVDAAEAAYERELDVLAAARRADIDRSAQSAPKPPPQPPGGGPS